MLATRLLGEWPRKELVINDIQPGDVIVGLASYGQATYESFYNGGMGSNGLTSARHDVLDHSYAERFPESFDPALAREVVYVGSRELTEKVTIEGKEMTVGKLILSPTRTYLPVIKRLLDSLKPAIHGMIHCTGGGQTKVIKFIDNVRVVKDSLLDIPPLFQLIQQESGTAWKEMYQVFNMGHRLEVYLPESEAEHVISIAQDFGIHAQVIGYVEAADRPEVLIRSPHGEFNYFE